MIRARFLIGTLIPAGLFTAGLINAQRPNAPTPSQKIDFNRDIRPILAKCATCHGPDTGEGVAGLRLDKFETATKTLSDGNRAIVPGKPEESELVKRIHATDASIMPPVQSHKTLSSEEKKLLEEWIRQGAEYKEHWAFVKPVRPPLPPVQNKKWAKNAIDRFILAKLEEEGLKPEPEAPKTTILRRVSLDITGLPPTPEEVDAFLADKSANAYEKAVDRLLASPRYGERMAMDWMDYSRYADSNGYQADYERFQSRWRDWVIDAFNTNMPYDQFTVEQIAGDLLPNATMEQKLATAFNRNHRINTEGGVIAEEWRVENVVDRVETTSAVWLGLTTGCARCHDHKYDPFTQKDFYRMYAYFNNVPESGSGEERPVNHPPTSKAPTKEQAAKLAQFDQEIQALDAKMGQAIAKNKDKAAGWKLETPLPQVTKDLQNRLVLQDNQTAFKKEGKVSFDVGRATGAVRTSNEGFLDLGGVGDVDKEQPFSFGGWIYPERTEGSPFSRMDSANGFRGWEFSLFQGRPQAHLINRWPENGAKIAGKNSIPANRWTHILVTTDGTGKAAGMKIYVDGKAVETNVENDKLTQTIKTTVTTKIGRRTNSEIYTGLVDDFVFFNRALAPEEAAKLASTHPAAALLTIPASKRSENQVKSLTRLWLLDHDPSFRALDLKYQTTTRARIDLDNQIPAVMVMEEMPKPRDCYVLVRGQYDKRGDKVDPGLPSFLPKLSDKEPNNRLGLARWIVSAENPLTARVTVNRLWERFFGNGIVQSIEDFGTRADFPTHPELLDYLATEFVRLDWDLKAMVKQIVMSATYRQSSNISDEKLGRDPLNRLLSRGPRYRLPGEVIRDQALFAAGLLVEKLGGPSVYPYQPDSVWDETNFYGNLRNYQHAIGTGLYRRSLYTIWKRTAAPPNMLTFDVPGREACRVRRARTDTPLQALVLMNDVTFVEAARVIAQRMIKAGQTPEERIAFGFKSILSRLPTAQEIQITKRSFEKRLAKFKSDPESAKQLINHGLYRTDNRLDPAELAAYAVTASTLLNLDEAVTKE